MGHGIKRSHLDCQRGIISGLEGEECPEKSKQQLLRIDTVFFFAIIFSFARSCNNENIVDS